MKDVAGLGSLFAVSTTAFAMTSAASFAIMVGSSSSGTSNKVLACCFISRMCGGSSYN